MRNRYISPAWACAFLPLALGSVNSRAGAQALSPWTALNPVQSFGFDTIDATDLNDSFSIPIMNRPGRGISIAARLNYNSQGPNFGWVPVVIGKIAGTTTYEGTCGIVTPFYDGDGDIIGYGDDGSVALYATFYFYWDQFGGYHPFTYYTTGSDDPSTDCPSPSGGFTLASPDQSGYTMVVNDSGTPAVYDPAGNTVTYYAATDRNGNAITLTYGATYDATYGVYTTRYNYFDTLNASTPALVIDGLGRPSSPLTYTWPGSGGSLVATEYFTSYATLCDPRGCGYGSVSAELPSSLALPDGTAYAFGYQNPSSGVYYQQVNQITLPTLGVVTLERSYLGSDLFELQRTTSLDATGWGFVETSTGTDVTDPASNLTHFALNSEGQIEHISSATSGMPDKVICYLTAGADGLGGCTGYSGYTMQTTLTANGKFMATGIMGPAAQPTQVDTYDWATTGTSAPLLRSTVTTYGESLSNGDGATAGVFPTEVVVKDGAGNQLARTTFGYDGTTPTSSGYGGTPLLSARANVTTVNAYSSGSAYLTTTMQYYDTGNVATKTDPNGGITTTSYGACNAAFPTSVQEAVTALSTSATWNCDGGVLTSATDENGIVTATSYATSSPYLWRPASVTADSGGASATTTSFAYTNASGSTPASFESTMLFNSSSSISESLTTFDALGRPHVKQARQGPSATTYDTVETDYDGAGRAYRASAPYQAAAGAASGAAFNTTTFDAAGRTASVTDAGGGVISFDYDANDVLTTVAGPSGENDKKKQTETDAAGDLTSVCEIVTDTTSGATPGSGTCSQSRSENGYLTTYGLAYASSSIVKTVTQNAQAGSGHQTRTFVTDQIGRMTSESNPESGTTAYTFDNESGDCGLASSGDLVKRVDAVGNITCYAHDAMHRVTAVTYPSGSYAAATPEKHFVYDSATVNAVAMGLAAGRLAEAYTGSLGSKTTDLGFSYARLGTVSDAYQSSPHSGGYYQTSAAYWENGAPKTTSGSSLTTLNYAVDAEGRSASVGAGSSTTSVVGSVSYSPYATTPNVSVALGTGDSDTYNFDPATGRITQYQFNLNGQTDTGALTWNTNGTLAQLAITDGITGTSDSQTCTYVHDDLMRLRSVSCPSHWSQTFSLDLYGNQAKSGTTSFSASFDLANQIAEVGSFTPAYDANGNLLDDPVAATHSVYSWDAENRPATLAAGSTTITLVKDALGRVVEVQNSSTGNTETRYSPAGAKLAIMSGTSLATEWAPLPGGGQVVLDAAGVIAYRHSDWLGSSRLTSSTSRTLLSAQALAPYGEVYDGTAATDVTFTGQQQDTVSGSSGLYDFLFREQSPTMSRWLSSDPAGIAAADAENPQSWNRYAYSDNNPCNLTDPLGLYPCSFSIAVTGKATDLFPGIEGEISRIFGDAGVGVLFDSANADYSLTIGNFVPQGAMISDSGVGYTPRVNGAELDFGIVFESRLISSDPDAAQNDTFLSIGLGRAASHEIGHFLLQTASHSSGIMSSAFSGAAWHTPDDAGHFDFRPDQALTLQSACRRMHPPAQASINGGGGGGGGVRNFGYSFWEWAFLRGFGLADGWSINIYSSSTRILPAQQ